MFIVFSGVSASGKNTIMKELCSRRKNTHVLTKSSGTTRPPRKGDETYLYFTNKEFEEGIKNGKFFEHENVHGFYYGILMDALEHVIENQDQDFVRDIDVHGQQRLKKFFSGKCPMVSIFLDAPDDVLAKRLKERGESDERIAVRLERGKLERACKKNYDLVIENLDKEKTLKIITDFLDKCK